MFRKLIFPSYHQSPGREEGRTFQCPGGILFDLMFSRIRPNDVELLSEFVEMVHVLILAGVILVDEALRLFGIRPDGSRIRAA